MMIKKKQGGRSSTKSWNILRSQNEENLHRRAVYLMKSRVMARKGRAKQSKREKNKATRKLKVYIL